MAANTSVMYMEAEECVVYLNGEYYSVISNVRSRPALVLKQCAEYLNIPEAEMRKRFAEAIEAIEKYRES